MPIRFEIGVPSCTIPRRDEIGDQAPNRKADSLLIGLQAESCCPPLTPGRVLTEKTVLDVPFSPPPHPPRYRLAYTEPRGASARARVICINLEISRSCRGLPPPALGPSSPEDSRRVPHSITGPGGEGRGEAQRCARLVPRVASWPRRVEKCIRGERRHLRRENEIRIVTLLGIIENLDRDTYTFAPVNGRGSNFPFTRRE